MEAAVSRFKVWLGCFLSGQKMENRWEGEEERKPNLDLSGVETSHYLLVHPAPFFFYFFIWLGFLSCSENVVQKEDLGSLEQRKSNKQEEASDPDVVNLQLKKENDGRLIFWHKSIR